MAETFASKHHDIKIELAGWDEPNNGRMLHIADLFINGGNVNKTYFKDWNRLDQRLEKYTMDSEDAKFIFVPSESGGFLINVPGLEQIKLPYKGLSTVTFLGNSFNDNLLLLIHSDEIIIFNLLNHVSTRVCFPEENIRWAELNEKQDLLVTYYDKNSHTIKQEIFDFKNQTTIQKEP